MEFTARLRFARISPTKVRPVARLVQDMPLNQALTILALQKQRAAALLRKLLHAAWANAQEKDPGYDEDVFYVKSARVDGGPALKRLRPRSMGRANIIRKRTCHIVVVLSDGEAAEER
jgi:large subunit ribosomal protein L22